MKAMILAAGLGTRLRPWTLSHPKALVPVGGVPMLRRVIERLRCEGVGRIGVNIHHFGEQIVEYLEASGESGAVVSDERQCLLDTGGGVAAMAPLLDPEGEGFLVHNVDILSDAPLGRLWRHHQQSGGEGVTLLTSDRPSSRRLVVDAVGALIGWHNLNTGERKWTAPAGERMLAEGQLREIAFSGIYVVGRGVAEEMRKMYGDAPFPIMEYLLNPERRMPVRTMEAKNLYLIDIGKPETLRQAGLELNG